jgi:hypothetical protein
VSSSPELKKEPFGGESYINTAKPIFRYGKGSPRQPFGELTTQLTVIFLVSLVLGVFVAGAEGVEKVTAHIPIALVISCMLLFPVFDLRLR